MIPPAVLGSFELALLTLTGFGLGRRLLQWLRVETEEPGERRLFSLLLGLGTLQFLPFLAFALRIGAPEVLRWLWTGVFVLVLPDTLHELRSLRGCFAPHKDTEFIAGTLKPFEIWQGVVLALFFAAIYVRTVCPAWEGDALSYHLTAPARFLYTGRFVFLPTLTYTNWPLGPGMLYALLLALSPTSPAAVVSFLLGGLTVALVYQFARQQGGRFAGMFAVCLLLALNDLWREMTTAMVDVGVTAFATAALFCLYRSLEDAIPHTGRARLAACFTGLAATMKLTGLWVIVALILVYAWVLWRRKSPQKIVTLLKFLVTAMIFPSLWYVKTWLLTGNPVYPMLYSVFGGREWTAAGWRRFQLGHLVFNAPQGVTPTPENLWHAHLQVAILGLGLALVFFVLATRSKYVVLLGAAAIFLGCVATGNYINGRFLLPVVPPLCCVLALALRNRARLLAIPCCLLASGLAFMTGYSVLKPGMSTACRVASGLESREDFLRSSNEVAPAAEYANRHLSRHERILIGGMLDYTALFHSEALWSAADLQDSIHYASHGRLDADLRRLKIGYFLFTPYPEDCAKNVNCRRRREAEETALNDLVSRRGRLLYEARGCRLYLLRP